ncbi:MAG: beta-galactosidase, partial [Paludibacteraceae bacterium]|nr:beta-galactosidase [Paludibacteraceae bacterium]
MRKSIYTMLLISSMVFYACTSQQPVRTDTLLREWQFTQDTTENPQWENVTIPHDWAISGPFDRANDLQEVIVVQNGEKEPTWKTGRSGGLPWMGKGHYKTRVAVKKDKFYTLVFDGAMSHADVYVNGEEVVYWPYGYNTFDCYILPGLITGDSVDIDVFLENKPQQSRWYPGAGLYRNVHLVETNPIHIPTFGVLIRTPKISKEFAQVTIDVDLQDGVEPIGTQNTEYRVQTDILYKGKVVATAEGQQSVAEVLNPQLWNPESPNLYTARTRVLKGEEVVDEVETRFGIRSISYTPEGGFQLNGETRKFKGVCNHHDLGPLGAAIHKDALRHQIKMLQDMGCDAIRTSHNMPAPELVELCDEMGMMMMVEPFDVWNWGKTENDYSVEFNEWWKWDISNMVKHYRNNACVMLWSSGNEVWNQVLPDGIEIVTKLQALFHELDPTRPVTNGMDQAMHIIHNGFGAAVELPGLNYRTGRYHEAYQYLPQKMILGSETASTVSSRGVYKTPA